MATNQSSTCNSSRSERDFEAEEKLMAAELEMAGLSRDKIFALAWDSPDENCVIDPTEFPPLPLLHLNNLRAPLHHYSLLLQSAVVLHLIDGSLAQHADSLLLNADRLVIHAYACGSHLPPAFPYQQPWETLLAPPGVGHIRLALHTPVLFASNLSSADPASFTIAFTARP
eukprot:CAMPEP_0172161840 /NCGR_PEP_ID=MMETSP1050-20130122/6340_1 /TAXON_ID=233186 /ORGANISM="Cryptomonas curvata, Strain CCAP979/52" /LENGTH=170 /DNA_ID=CAMNT_0012831765 /DNA_START=108 /DNA_END=616 /DNA_ORIENTATION=-